MKTLTVIALVIAPMLVLAAHPENPTDFTPTEGSVKNFDAKNFDEHSSLSCGNGLACGGGIWVPEEFKDAPLVWYNDGGILRSYYNIYVSKKYREDMLITARQMLANNSWRGFYDMQVGDSGHTFGYWIELARL